MNIWGSVRELPKAQEHATICCVPASRYKE